MQRMKLHCTKLPHWSVSLAEVSDGVDLPTPSRRWQPPNVFVHRLNESEFALYEERQMVMEFQSRGILSLFKVIIELNRSVSLPGVSLAKHPGPPWSQSQRRGRFLSRKRQQQHKPLSFFTFLLFIDLTESPSKGKTYLLLQYNLREKVDCKRLYIIDKVPRSIDTFHILWCRSLFFVFASKRVHHSLLGSRPNAAGEIREGHKKASPSFHLNEHPLKPNTIEL